MTLQLNAQDTATLAAIDTDFDSALLGGVTDPDSEELVAGLPSYNTLTTEIKTLVRASYLAGLAALLANYEGGGSSVSPATTVTSATAFGASSSVGVGTAYARNDHTHGTPVNPVIAHEAASDPHPQYLQAASVPTAAASVVSETSFGAAAAVGVATTYARGDHTHGTPTDPHPRACGCS